VLSLKDPSPLYLATTSGVSDISPRKSESFLKYFSLGSEVSINILYCYMKNLFFFFNSPFFNSLIYCINSTVSLLGMGGVLLKDYISC